MPLFLDTKPLKVPQGSWEDARNIITSRIPGVTINEEGNELLATGYPIGSSVIGVLPLPDESIVVFSENTSSIGIIKEGVYTDIIKDSVLNFSKEFPVKAEFQFNAKGEVVIAFTDNNNNPRILNIDNVPFKLNADKSFVDNTDINEMSLFPKSTPPVVSGEVKMGGSIKSGAYFVSFGYKNNDGTETNYHGIDGPFYITGGDSSGSFDNYEGVKANTTSNKAIKFSLSSVDTRYDSLVMVIISVREGITEAAIIKEIDITGESLTATYVGGETETPITLNEAFVDRPNYTKAKGITQVEDSLYLSHLKAEEQLDFQKYANSIVINWTATNKTNLHDNVLASHKGNVIEKSFMYGEVVAFYIAFELKSGGYTRAFHIPGRAPSGSDREISTTASAKDITAKVYQFDDTCDSNAQSYELNNGVYAPTSLDKSNMGFWENENEFYPTGFPDLEGEKVRHHKFPSARFLKKEHDTSNNKFGSDQFPLLGILVNIKEKLPQDLKDKVKGYRIFYAKPSPENSTVLSYDFLHISAKRLDDPNTIWNSGGNFGINSQGSSTNPEDMRPYYDSIRVGAPDLLKNKPSINPTHIALELEFSKPDINREFGATGLTDPKDGTIVTRTGDTLGQVSTIVMDLTSDNTVTQAALNNLYQKATSFKYLPQGVNDGNDWNVVCNETGILKLKSSTLNNFLDADAFSLKTASNNRAADSFANTYQGRTEYRTALISLRQVRSDVFTSYDSQELVATDKYITDLDDTPLIHGGDTFISYYSYISKAPIGGGTFIDDTKKGVTGVHVIHAGLLPTRNNFNLRHEDVSLIGSKYYPKTAPKDFVTDYPNSEDLAAFIIDTDEDTLNLLQYNSDYSEVNKFNPIVPASTRDEYVSDFPNRVIRGGVSNREGVKLVSWRTFLETDYYEANKNRGPIENIESLGDVLLIHHKYGLFKTLGRQKLSIGATEVTLGTGEIFDNEPKEVIVTEHGYLGCSDRFFSFVCKLGYVWGDALNRGKIFLLSPSNGIKEISNTGIANYLANNVKTKSGNPFIDDGLTGAFDEVNNRILFTHKHKDNPFTISYSLLEEKWVCFHDYTPNLLFSTRNNMYSIHEGQIYKHNAKNKATFYGTIYPSYVEPIINSNPLKDKLIYSINWDTEVRDSEDNILKDSTFTSVQISNSYQDTGEILLSPFKSFGKSHNIRRDRSTWNFNKITTPNSNPFKKADVIDKYIKIKLIYNNEKGLNSLQNSLYLYNVSAKTHLTRQ